MEDLVFGELRLRVDASRPSALAVVWEGKSVDRQPGKVLDPYLEALVASAKDGQRSLEMRFERIEHFNSSTITSLIGLVQRARASAVPLSLVYDKSLKWQRLSFDALRVLGKSDGLLEVRSV